LTRSGYRVWARPSVARRCARTSIALPKWTEAGAFTPIPEWRRSWL
jgi:hypothetical protein